MKGRQSEQVDFILSEAERNIYNNCALFWVLPKERTQIPLFRYMNFSEPDYYKPKV